LLREQLSFSKSTMLCFPKKGHTVPQWQAWRWTPRAILQSSLSSYVPLFLGLELGKQAVCSPLVVKVVRSPIQME